MAKSSGERFDYRPLIVRPSPADPSTTVYRPIVPITVRGLGTPVSLAGLLDTGAQETVFPMSLKNRIVPEFIMGGAGKLRGLADQEVDAHYARINFTFQTKLSAVHWTAIVAFADHRPEVLLGHIGFLERFTARFVGPGRYVILSPRRARGMENWPRI